VQTHGLLSLTGWLQHSTSSFTQCLHTSQFSPSRAAPPSAHLLPVCCCKHQPGAFVVVTCVRGAAPVQQLLHSRHVTTGGSNKHGLCTPCVCAAPCSSSFSGGNLQASTACASVSQAPTVSRRQCRRSLDCHTACGSALGILHPCSLLTLDPGMLTHAWLAGSCHSPSWHRSPPSTATRSPCSTQLHSRVCTHYCSTVAAAIDDRMHEAVHLPARM
jgi:hypothetical protein